MVSMRAGTSPHKQLKSKVLQPFPFPPITAHGASQLSDDVVMQENTSHAFLTEQETWAVHSTSHQYKSVPCSKATKHA